RRISVMPGRTVRHDPSFAQLSLLLNWDSNTFSPLATIIYEARRCIRTGKVWPVLRVVPAKNSAGGGEFVSACRATRRVQTQLHYLHVRRRWINARTDAGNSRPRSPRVPSSRG